MKFASVAFTLILTSASQAQLTIAGFSASRGGELSLSDGSALGTVRNEIAVRFPGAAIRAGAALDHSLLSGTQVLIISSATSESSATSLSSAERDVLRSFVMGGNGVVILTESDSFAGAGSGAANASFLADFGVQSTGTGGAWPRPTRAVWSDWYPVTNGPFAPVPNWTVGTSGWFTTYPAHSLAIGLHTDNNRPNALLFTAGALGPGSGVVVLLADSTMARDGLVTPANLTLLMNAIAFSRPNCRADIDNGTGVGLPDGGVTIDDLLYYLILFESGSAAADMDDGQGMGLQDGGVTIDDLLYFLSRFEAGC